MIETAKAKKAFVDYYNLGPGRSLRILFEQYRTAPKAEVPTRRMATIRNWSSKHGWQERVIERDAEIAQAQFEEIKQRATETGYAVFQKRIWDLGQMAEILFDEVQDEQKRWLADVKSIGQGENAERVDIVRFNEGLLRQFRGTLDDIAKEMGERQKNINLHDQGTQQREEQAARYDDLLVQVYGN